MDYIQQTSNDSPTLYEENPRGRTYGNSLRNRVYGRSNETSSFEHTNDWYHKKHCLKSAKQLKNNAHQIRYPTPVTVKKGNFPGDNWQIDFAELPWQKCHRYLLVLIDTFSGWPEASSCCTTKAGVRFWWRKLSQGLECEWECHQTEVHIIAEIAQNPAKMFGVKWDLHTPWRPQSIGK